MTTILVVDDSLMDRRIAGGILEKHSGWDVIYAVDGQNAVEQIELHLPDAVVTDLQMP
ncbi:MAG: response regulator, partial [Planctomycetes bacterium]|nr:response regulator [Planctomycetota bacterium]